MILEIGCRLVRARSNESAGLGDVRRQGAALEQGILREVAEPGGVVDRVRARRLVEHAREEVILQVAPDARQVVAYPNIVLAEMLGLADAGEHEKLGRVDRARREDDLTLSVGTNPIAVNFVLDAGRAVAVERDLHDLRPGPHGQVVAVEHRLQEPVGGAVALAFFE